MTSLEALENLAKNVEGNEEYHFEHFKKDYEIIENDLKVLELIKKKKINVIRLALVLSNFEDWSLSLKLKWYNGDVWFSEENYLEIDEFIYLKSWLESK